MKQQRAPARWFIIPVFFGLVGGVVVYLFIRKDDPSRAKWCILAGLISSVFWFFVFVAIVAATGWSNRLGPGLDVPENDRRSSGDPPREEESGSKTDQEKTAEKIKKIKKVPQRGITKQHVIK